MAGYKNIDVTELQSMMAKGGIRLVDVRTDAEIAQGIIQGADKLPLHLLPVSLSKFDSKQPTVFYCRMGGRSAQAAAYMAGQGLHQAYNLLGGITAWMQAGLPLSK
ncbi:MAG: rhodanese-like domain-containing protein [Gallionellaceae bacterium]